MSQNTPVSAKIIKLSIDIYLIYIFLNFQYFWTKRFGDSYTTIRQIFSTWQWFPSNWCDYIWICKNVQYLNEKPVKVVERSKFTIVNMFSMHINNFFFYFIYFSYSLRTVYFLDCLYLGLLGVGTSLFPPINPPPIMLASLNLVCLLRENDDFIRINIYPKMEIFVVVAEPRTFFWEIERR